jgi:hypothetical protein
MVGVLILLDIARHDLRFDQLCRENIYASAPVLAVPSDLHISRGAETWMAVHGQGVPIGRLGPNLREGLKRRQDYFNPDVRFRFWIVESGHSASAGLGQLG